MIKNKKIKILAMSMLFALTITFSLSYGYYLFSKKQNKDNVSISGCIKLNLLNESNAINLTNMYPISDKEGRSLTPYSFSITNTCTMTAAYTINLEELEGTTLNSKYVAVLLNEDRVKVLSDFLETDTVINSSTEARVLMNDYLPPNDSKTYTLSLWMDKNVSINDDAMNKVFKSKIVVNTTGTKSTAEKIISQLDDTGKCPKINENGSINVEKIEKNEGYLCSAPDDYGTSYYYRGNVVNNYVYFAGFYWRIVRTNGDGSIRIVYDGKEPHENSEASNDKIIHETYYQIPMNDNAHVGYMYGTAASASYEETHANLNNSHVKNNIDNWYANTILKLGFDKYLSDNIFCNDRSFSSANTGTGIGQSATYYRKYYDETNHTFLKCLQKNDAFTVDDITNGNGALTYPVGLLTADEYILAGSTTEENNESYFLYSGTNLWTMSPYYFNFQNARMRMVDVNGKMVSGWIQYNRGVKPVVNLKPGILLYGDGTKENPYRIDEEITVANKYKVSALKELNNHEFYIGNINNTNEKVYGLLANKELGIGLTGSEDNGTGVFNANLDRVNVMKGTLLRFSDGKCNSDYCLYKIKTSRDEYLHIESNKSVIFSEEPVYLKVKLSDTANYDGQIIISNIDETLYFNFYSQDKNTKCFAGWNKLDANGYMTLFN